MGRRKMPWWGWVLVLTLPVWLVPALVAASVCGMVAATATWICDIANWQAPGWCLSWGGIEGMP